VILGDTSVSAHCPFNTNRNEPIIPQCARAGRPLEPHLDVHVLLVDVVQVVEEDVALGAVEPYDVRGHCAVDPECLGGGLVLFFFCMTGKSKGSASP
jgi:hypothetical protein